MSVRRKPGSPRKVLRRLGALVALAGALSAAGAAAAPAPMPLGARTAPPAGFVDFCRRQPADCGLDAAVAQARGTAVQQASSWTRRFAAVRQGPAAIQAPERLSPAADAPAADAPTMTPELRALAQRVNREINRAIARRSDQAAYGTADRWATPLADGGRYGDCEDYVLEKRRALIAAGVPANTLNIALVTTRWGEAHAVLLLLAGGGEYVLDNLEPWILPWDQTPYRWRARQVGGDPFVWAQAATD